MVKLFIDEEKDYVVSKIELPNGKLVKLGENCENYSELEKFVGQDIEVLYGNGEVEKGSIVSVGYTDDCEPFFSFSVLNQEIEEENNE